VALTRMIRRRGSGAAAMCPLFDRGDERRCSTRAARLGRWQYVPSLLAAIGDVIERHMIDIGFLPARPGRESAPSRFSTSRRSSTPGNTLRGSPGPAAQAMPRNAAKRPLIRLEDCEPVHELRLFQMRVVTSQHCVLETAAKPVLGRPEAGPGRP